MDGVDSILVKKAKLGDSVAFEQLVVKYQKSIFNIAYRMTGSYDDAIEIAQEAFIRIYKSIRNYKEDCSFSTWIFRIATNLCLDELRKRKNKTIVYMDEEYNNPDGIYKYQFASEDPGPEEMAEKMELKAIVQAAITKIPVEFRTVLVLRDIEGLSYNEIAEMLKIPDGTVKSRLNRARNILRDLLKTERELFG